MFPTDVKVLGIDLGGAKSGTTGWSMIEAQADGSPLLTETGTLPRPRTAKGNRASIGEETLYALIKDQSPNLLAVDAPLTLPPCVMCTSAKCGIPGPSGCKSPAAQRVWADDGHPLTERHCELFIKGLGAPPLPTMRIGQIATRGTALRRYLERQPESMDVIEVYPAATLKQLSVPRAKAETHLRSILGGKDAASPRNPHELDAVIAAYTGWLYLTNRVIKPKSEPGYDPEDGWIWVPVAVTKKAPRSPQVDK